MAEAPAPTGPTAFHEVVSKDHATFKPEADRYILYMSYACPWASRCLIARKLKKLDSIIKIVSVDPLSCMCGDGWMFNPQVDEDPVMKATSLRELYLAYCPNYAGNFTVPMLFDTKTKAIVNNESAEILRIFNTGFNDILPGKKIDLYPEALRDEIDKNLNPWILENINRGVYRTGNSKTQEDYETNCKTLFEALDKVEGILAKKRFLAGTTFTEADIRLFTTIVRMPTLYECHYKCNLKSLRDGNDYPNIFKWLKTVYQMPGVSETVNQDHIKRHFYVCQKDRNPTSIVPLYNGPNLSEPKYPTSDADFTWFK